MRACGATALAVDAGRTVFFDREKLIELANQVGIAIQAFPVAGELNSAAKGMNRE
jgi:DUF1009 family protein